MTDPFGDDDLRADTVDDTHDSGFEDPRNPFVPGCLFPGECCMPCDHFTSECHTAEMMEEMMREQERQAKGSPSRY